MGNPTCRRRATGTATGPTSWMSSIQSRPLARRRRTETAVLTERLDYLLHGLYGRRTCAQACPACGSAAAALVDRKWFHRLLECRGCRVLYRYPYEPPEEVTRFYQGDYR